MEIADICSHLEKPASLEVISPDARDSCSQAASLLVEMRALVISRRPGNDNLEQLRLLLAKQGEG